MKVLLFFSFTHVLLSVLADDFPSDDSTTVFLRAATARIGEIETAGDEDWFKTYFRNGRTYTVTIYTPDSSLDPVLSIAMVSPSTTVLSTNDNYSGLNLNSRIVHPSTSAEYIFVIVKFNGGGTGQYVVEVSDTTTACSADCASKVSNFLCII